MATGQNGGTTTGQMGGTGTGQNGGTGTGQNGITQSRLMAPDRLVAARSATRT
jgi:hypothetical protein